MLLGQPSKKKAMEFLTYPDFPTNSSISTVTNKEWLIFWDKDNLNKREDAS
jgi:hypothetical protein